MDYARQEALPVTKQSSSDALWVTYRWMSLGLATTGVVALGIAHSPDTVDLLLGNRLLFYMVLFGQLGLVVALSSMAARLSTAAAAALFFAYAALSGVTFSLIFLVYTASSIASTFFITAGTFAGLSVFGAVTRADLTGIGRFALFALIGFILATFVNFFLHSTGLGWALTLGGILIFAGLTAYDTQKLKRLFEQGDVPGSLPLVGALMLYLDFINMFLLLLRLTGSRRR